MSNLVGVLKLKQAWESILRIFWVEYYITLKQCPGGIYGINTNEKELEHLNSLKIPIVQHHLGKTFYHGAI